MTAKIIDIKASRKKLDNAKQAAWMDDIVALNIATWAVFWRTIFAPILNDKRN